MDGGRKLHINQRGQNKEDSPNGQDKYEGFLYKCISDSKAVELKQDPTMKLAAKVDIEYSKIHIFHRYVRSISKKHQYVQGTLHL